MRSNVISSQIALHTLYGGVVPEIASRKHIEKINQVIEQALADAQMTLDDIDAIGVTYGPGLVGALLVGVAEAKAISYAKDLPLIGVHHIEGHISANYIENPDLVPPFLCLVVSGGHTHLVKVTDYGKYEILGRTRDDAAGEAFDKVARAIGLGYPGGPKIEQISHEGDPHAISFPRAKIADDAYDFSFSGLKSAVLNYLNGCRMKDIPINRADVAASFQQSVTDVLVEHARQAIREYQLKQFAIAGGVASNGTIRAAMAQMCAEEGVTFYHPSPILCTDNAAMIGAAAYYDFIAGKRAGLDLNAVPNLKLGD
jgi:N6-L-threonylcarbamoyladenine synthase